MIGRGKVVLLVEPEPGMRQMFSDALRALKFEQVLAVPTAAQGRAALVPGTGIDLALIDWAGEPSGFDLAADVRTGRVSPRRDLPIIMTAWKAETRSALAVQGLKLNGLLVKPVSRDMLERKIAAALDPANREPMPKPAAGRAS